MHQILHCVQLIFLSLRRPETGVDTECKVVGRTYYNVEAQFVVFEAFELHMYTLRTYSTCTINVYFLHNIYVVLAIVRT